jgi:hypothetical protein
MDIINWEIIGLIILVSILFFVLFTAVRLLIRYIRNYKD